ncbi:MAG: acyl-CoA dehydratase activase [Dehalococcoidia bacterium]|nr:acyl-CoA dehydratase activase [Dehalococcoidia bacterium]
MATIGVDAGSLTTKAVVMDGSLVLGRSLVHSSVKDAGLIAIAEALKAAGLSREQVTSVVATGIGRAEVPGSSQATEIACDARGAKHLVPSATTVIDMGAEGSRAIRCDASGRVVDFVLNDKCAAGCGVFLDAMAKALRVSVAEMGELSLKSTQDVNITAMCVVFAESEVVSQIHRRVPKEDILNGIHKSIATRLVGMANRIGVNKDVVVVGGVARNVGVVRWLRELLNVDIVVPESPEFAGATGAALIAVERT